LVILASGALSFASGCGSKKEDGGKHADEKAGAHKDEKAGEHKGEGLIKLSDAEAAQAGVKTEALAEQQLADTLNVTATIEANPERMAHVLPRIPGRIVSVSAKLGGTVTQGQVLATLESIEAGEAYSAYAQALAEANVAKAAYERAERLHADQIIPGKEYQRAKGEHDKTQAHVQAAAGKLRMLGIAPSAGAKGGAVSNFPVIAPLSGTVIERKAVLGELAKTDEPLFMVADLSRVWLQANIGEADLGRVRIGATARVSIAGRPGEVFEGKVSHLGAMLDKETRTAKAIVELDNSKGFLRPQMFASVAIETGTARKVLALPESAVTLVQGLATVFVEEAGGFEARPVELAGRSGGKAIVKSGVKPGELVVTEGTYALKARLLKSQIGDTH
jgi:cobalt-zinc-cadmium efflux system membrane fusion protein